MEGLVLFPGLYFLFHGLFQFASEFSEPVVLLGPADGWRYCLIHTVSDALLDFHYLLYDCCCFPLFHGLMRLSLCMVCVGVFSVVP